MDTTENRIIKDTGNTLIVAWNGKIDILPKTPYIRLFFELQQAGTDSTSVGDLTVRIEKLGDKVALFRGDTLVLETSQQQIIDKILERNEPALKGEIALTKQWNILRDFVDLTGVAAEPAEIGGRRGFLIDEHFFVSENGDSHFYIDGRLSHLCIVPQGQLPPKQQLHLSILGFDVDLSENSVLCLAKMLYVIHRRELGDQVFWSQVKNALGEDSPIRLNTRDSI